MKTTLLLGDFARVSDGKLDVLGAGWSVTGPDPASFGIGILFAVSWDETNTKHRFMLDLLDIDGNQVPTPTGEPLLHLENEFEVGRPAGMKPGTQQTGPFALNVAGIPLPTSGKFEVRLAVEGYDDAGSNVAFATRPQGPEAIAA
jgi:hypothetical protein